MFGFSLPKLIVLAAIVAAIWYVYKLIERRTGGKGRGGSSGASSGASSGTSSGGDAAPKAVDMNKCTVCGDYVSAETPTACDRAGCPY